MSPELKLELDKKLVEVAFPDWEWRDDDMVSHTFSYDSGGGCYTCGYGDPGTELNIYVERSPEAYLSGEDFKGDRDFRTYYDGDIETVWLAVMG